MQSIKNKVIARIYGKGRGWVFTQSDFGDISNRDGIDTVTIGNIAEVRLSKYPTPTFAIYPCNYFVFNALHSYNLLYYFRKKYIYFGNN